MENQESWLKQQQHSGNLFSKELEDYSTAKHGFWQNLVMVEATIVGLIVGLFGVGQGSPSCVLKIACAALLISLSIGCLLIKVNLDHKLEASLRKFRFSYDFAGIEQMIESGQIQRGSDDHAGLFIAATMDTKMDMYAEPMPWTPLAYEFANKMRSRLPSSRFFRDPERSCFAVWMEKNILRIQMAFYVSSVVALLLLLGSIVTR